MKDPRIEKYANVILDYCIKLKKDQLICLRGSLAEPLILELYKAALLKGAHPYTRVLLQGLEEIYFKYSSEKQLKFITPIQKYELNNSDALVAIMSSFNTRELTNIDPQKQAVAQMASKPIMEKTMKRAAQGKFSWVPTPRPRTPECLCRITRILCSKPACSIKKTPSANGKKSPGTIPA
jgi:aminopeptidase